MVCVNNEKLCAQGRITNTTPGPTFFTGDVGVVTWLVGLVGDDVLMPVAAGVVLLLTDAEALLLSGEKQCFETCMSQQRTTKENNRTSLAMNIHVLFHVVKRFVLNLLW